MPAGQGLYPVSPVTDQKQMLCPGQAQVSLSFQEQSFPEILSGFRTAISDPLQQVVTTVPSTGLRMMIVVYEGIVTPVGIFQLVENTLPLSIAHSLVFL